jgi:hypothetical protein
MGLPEAAEPTVKIVDSVPVVLVVLLLRSGRRARRLSPLLSCRLLALRRLRTLLGLRALLGRLLPLLCGLWTLLGRLWALLRRLLTLLWLRALRRLRTRSHRPRRGLSLRRGPRRR